MAVIIKDTGEGHISLSLNATGLSKELLLLRAEHGRLVAAKNSLQQDYNQARGDRSILQAQINREKAQQDRMLSQIKTLEEQQKEQALRVSRLELSCNRCPSEWEVEKDTCYYFPTPARVQRKGWNDAKADCITRGAQLVVIDTLEKQKFIAGVVRTRHSEGFNYISGYWIGLSEQEEGWHWITGSLITTGYWMPGEPNDYGVGAEDCAATYPKVDPLQTWNDAPCSYPLMWICEKNATSLAGSS
ncbi:hypothetical protein ACEWY4_012125 [Coilia grayii]|uniref:C-type lectin domain-containing protein n=1 Tax=Coilia grayii TaxID=363190 RepID=A0ABD1JZL3_9TELE